MIYIRPFKKEDLLAFDPIEPLSLREIKDEEFAQAIEDSKLAITGIRNGEIVGCGGVHPTDDGHGEMWLRLSETCRKFPLDTLRWLKDGMEIVEQTYPFEQLNATIQCCFEKSIRLVEHLGFKRTEEKIYEGKKWLIYSKRIE